MKFASLMVSGVLASGLCFADTFVQTLNFSLSISNSTASIGSPASNSITLNFDMFHPVLGTLTSIDYALVNSDETQSLFVSGSRSNVRVFGSTSAGQANGHALIFEGGGTSNLTTDLIAANCNTGLSGGTFCSSTTNDSAAVTGSHGFADTTGYVGFGTIPVALDLFASRSNPSGTCIQVPGGVMPQ